MTREEMTKLRKIYLDEYGQLPMEVSFYLFDHAYKIEVDYWYLQNMLKRLFDLEKLAKTHLAEIDIPITIKYLLSSIPKKYLTKYETMQYKKKQLKRKQRAKKQRLNK